MTLRKRAILLFSFLPLLQATSFWGQTQAPQNKAQFSAIAGSRQFPLSSRQCAAADGYVYWLTGGDKLVRADREGRKSPAVVANAHGHLGPFAIAGTSVYYMVEHTANDRPTNFEEKTLGDVRKLDLTTGDTTTIVSDMVWPGLAYLTTDETDIYFTAAGVSNEDAILVQRVSKSGGEVHRVVSGIKAPSGLVVDRDHIYWADFADHTVAKAAKDGGDPVLIFKGDVMNDSPASLAADEQSVFLLTGQGDVYQIAKSGNQQKKIFRNALATIITTSYLATDEASLLWIFGYRVMRLNLKTGSSQVLATRKTPPICATIDDKYIYWNDKEVGFMKSTK